MSDLFSSSDEIISLMLRGADLKYVEHLDVKMREDELLQEIIKETTWRQEEITVWGKKFLQPRLIAWHGEKNAGYTYSGIKLAPLPWTETLLMIRSKIQALTGEDFNSVLLNYYRNGSDSMGFHSDNEKELGRRPFIASYSLGQERTLVFKSILNKDEKPFRVDLKSGSLLIMSGDTQKNWQHGIEKIKRECGPRVNLTFRQVSAS